MKTKNKNIGLSKQRFFSMVRETGKGVFLILLVESFCIIGLVLMMLFM